MSKEVMRMVYMDALQRGFAKVTSCLSCLGKHMLG